MLSSFIVLQTDSARSFMKTHQLGHFNEEDMAKKKAELAARTEEQKAAADAISVGSRCKVQVAGQPSKLGTVMYVGEWKKIPSVGLGEGVCAGAVAHFITCCPRYRFMKENKCCFSFVVLRSFMNLPIKTSALVFSVGTTLFKPGYWVGVKYDEPLGKNNGT